MARTKPALSQWIADNRKRMGWKAETLAERLREAGYEAADTTVRTWEAGRSPRPETIAAMERLFDSSAPADEVGVGGEIAAALDRQSSAIEALVEELRLARAAQVEVAAVTLQALGALGVRLDPQGNFVEAERVPPAGTRR